MSESDNLRPLPLAEPSYLSEQKELLAVSDSEGVKKVLLFERERWSLWLTRQTVKAAEGIHHLTIRRRTCVE